MLLRYFIILMTVTLSLLGLGASFGADAEARSAIESGVLARTAGRQMPVSGVTPGGAFVRHSVTRVPVPDWTMEPVAATPRSPRSPPVG